MLIAGSALFAGMAAAQTRTGSHTLAARYFQNLFYDTTDRAIPQLRGYPTAAYSPETSWEFGISSVLVYYANRDTTNRLSEVTGFTFVTLEQQYGAWFDHALYTQGNRWFFLGRIRLQDFPLYYHGIGFETPRMPVALVNNRQVQVRERVLRQLYKNVFAGAEVDFQKLSRVSFDPREGGPLELPTGRGGSSNLGLGVGILYDSRHNILNVRRGLFSEIAFMSYHNRWGSEYNFNTLQTDTRIFRPLGRRDVLAFQALGQFNFGDVPFNQLALMGGESMMRGYYLGRFRDKNMVATQIEYRMLPLPFDYTKRWGAAVFASAGTVFDEAREVRLDRTLWAAGGGVRFLLFPKKDVYTRLDVAFTPEGSGVYLFIGEAF